VNWDKTGADYRDAWVGGQGFCCISATDGGDFHAGGCKNEKREAVWRAQHLRRLTRSVFTPLGAAAQKNRPLWAVFVLVPEQPVTPFAQVGLLRQMITGSGEANVRMAFLRELQVDAAGRNVHQLPIVVMREVRLVFIGKGFQRFVIWRFYPARGGNVHPLKLALDVVFGFQAFFDNIELQHTDGAKDEVVANQRLEKLGRPFFAELFQPFQERFHFQRVFQADAAEEFRREVWECR
jgi:hypothetical protein